MSGLGLTRTRVTLLVETDNVGCIASPELTIAVVTGDAQLVFVIEQNTVASSIRCLLRATIDDFHKSFSAGGCPITELTIVVVTRGPQTAILLQNHSVVGS